jgi:hypothetical protein
VTADLQREVAIAIVRAFVALRRRGPHSIHVVIDIEAPWKRWAGFLTHDNGVPLTAYEFEEARAHFKRLGYAVFPTCQSHDERGYCAGHPTEGD